MTKENKIISSEITNGGRTLTTIYSDGTITRRVRVVGVNGAGPWGEEFVVKPKNETK